MATPTNIVFTSSLNPAGLISGTQQAVSQVQKNLGNISKGFSLGRITGDFRKFEESLDSATARVLAFTATTSLIYGMGSAFKRLTVDAIKIEAVMTRIQVIFGSTADETKRFQGEIFRLANATSTSFNEAAEAAEEFSRQGLSLNETLTATKAALAIAKLSGTSAKSAIEGLTATIATFGDKAGSYTDVAGKLLALDAKFATSAGGIIEGLKRVAGVAEEAGLSLDETASAITALKQVTGRSEAVLGNSIKSIFTSLQSSKIIEELRGIGVEVADSNGEFKSLVPVVRELSVAFDGLGDAQKAALTQKIAGKYQANAFQGLLKAFQAGGQFDKALKTSGGSADQLEKRLAAIFGTTEAGLQRLSNRITEFGGQVGTKLGKPIVDSFANVITSLLDTGSTLFKESGGGLGDALVSGLVTTVTGPGAVLLAAAFGKLVTRLVSESATAFKAVAGIGAVKQRNLVIDQYAHEILKQLPPLEHARIAALTTVEARQKAITAELQKQLALSATATKYNNLGFSAANIPTLGLPGKTAGSIYTKIKQQMPSRASGDLPERAALIREAIDIRNGVGGARPHARPRVEHLNLGQGREKVVVNSDEKIVRNYGGGRDAVLNREMMGYAGGYIGPTKRLIKQLEARGTKLYRDQNDFSHYSAERNYINIGGDIKSRGISPIATLLHEAGHGLDRSNIRGAHGELDIRRKVRDRRSDFAKSRSKYQSPSVATNRQTRIPYDLDKGVVIAQERVANINAAKLMKQMGYSPDAQKSIFSSLLSKSYKGYLGSVGPGPGSLKNVASGSVPTFVFDAYAAGRGKETNESRTKAFRKAGFQRLDYSNIAEVAKQYAGSGIKPLILDPIGLLQEKEYRADVEQNPIAKKILQNFRIQSGKSVPLDKYQEATQGGLSKSIKLSEIPGFSGYRSKNAINQVIEHGRKVFGNDNFYIKGAVGAQGDSVYSPGGLYYNRDNQTQRKFLPRAFGTNAPGGELFLQQGIPNISGRELRVHAITEGNKAKILDGAFVKRGPKSQGILGAVGDRLSKGIAAAQLKRAMRAFDPSVSHLSFAGADVAETGNRGISKFVQYLSEKSGIKFGKAGGGVVEYNFAQDSKAGQAGASGYAGHQDVMIDAARKLKAATSPQGIIARGREILKLQGEEQKKEFKSFYKSLLQFKSVSPDQYIPTVKALGGLGYGVTAGRGRGKRFVSPKSLARGFAAESKYGTPYLTDLKTNGRRELSIVNSNETIVPTSRGDAVIPNYAGGKYPTAYSPASQFTPFFANIQEARQRRLEAQQKQSEAREKRLERSDKIRGRVAAGGFGVSFLGGAISSQFTDSEGGETSTSRKVSGVSSYVGAGAALAAFGPAGAAIGGLVAVVGTVSTVFDDSKDKLAQYQKNLKKTNEEYASQQGAIEAYINGLDLVNQAIKSGSATAITLAKQQLASTLKGQDPDLVAKFTSAKSDEERAVLRQQFAEEGRRKIAGGEARAAALKLNVDEGRGVVGTLFRGRRSSTEGDRGAIASSIASTVDVAKLTAEQIEGLRDAAKGYAGTGSAVTSVISEQGFAAIQDFSSKNVGSRALTAEVAEELIKAIEANTLAEKDVSEQEEKAKRNHNYQGLLSSKIGKASLDSFKGGLSKETDIAIASSNLESLRDSLTDVGYATAAFRIEGAKAVQSLEGAKSDTFQNIANDARNSLGDNINSDQESRFANALDSFTKNQDYTSFSSSIKDILGPKFDDFNKNSISHLEELSKVKEKIVEDTRASTNNFRNLINQIQQSQRATLYGGGNITESIDEALGLATKELAGRLGGPIKNQYADAARGFGPSVETKYGRRSLTNKEAAAEARRLISAEGARGRAGIKGLEAAKGAGLLGIDLDDDSPLKGLQDKFKDQNRQAYKGYTQAALADNAQTTTLSNFDTYTGDIETNAKRKYGFTPQDYKKGVRESLEKGDYDSAINKLEESRGGFSFEGKAEEANKTQQLIDFLKLQQEYTKVIPQAAEEASKRFEPESQVDALKRALSGLEAIESTSQGFLSSIEGILSQNSKNAAIAAAETEIAASTYRQKELEGNIFTAKDDLSKHPFNNKLLQAYEDKKKGVLDPGFSYNTYKGIFPKEAQQSIDEIEKNERSLEEEKLRKSKEFSKLHSLRPPTGSPYVGLPSVGPSSNSPLLPLGPIAPGAFAPSQAEAEVKKPKSNFADSELRSSDFKEGVEEFRKVVQEEKAARAKAIEQDKNQQVQKAALDVTSAVTVGFEGLADIFKAPELLTAVSEAMRPAVIALIVEAVKSATGKTPTIVPKE